MSESQSVFDNIDLRDLDPKEAKRWWDWGLGWLDNFRLWRKSKPEYRILVAGAGGVGKSTLRRLLDTDVDFLVNDVRQYVESMNVETLETETDEGSSIVHVLPGQSHRRNLWERCIARLKDGYYDGVILMGCYGYHALNPMDYESGSERFETTTRGAFLQQYLPECRQKEISVAKDILENVIACNRKRIWVLTIVSKEDLWAGPKRQRTEVATHYKSGDYNDAVQTMLAMPRVPERIRVETLFLFFAYSKTLYWFYP